MVRNAGNIICVYGDSYKEKKVSFEFFTRIRKETDQKTSSEKWILWIRARNYFFKANKGLKVFEIW